MNLDWNLIRKQFNKSLYVFNTYFNEKIEGKLKYFELCYCDFEKFFDDNEIIIEIQTNSIYWYYYISQEQFSYNGFNEKDFYNSRQLSKIAAIYKAFEILEGKLGK